MPPSALLAAGPSRPASPSTSSAAAPLRPNDAVLSPSSHCHCPTQISTTGPSRSRRRRRRASDAAASWAYTLLASALLVLLAMASCVPSASAHMIELGPHKRECFFEELNPGDQMTLTFQVGGGGNLDIDVWLTEPSQRRLYELKHRDTGSYSFTAQLSGRYTYCFSNEFSTVTDKTVSFNVHGIIYVPDDGEMLPIEREIRDLAASLQAVKDEQEYLVVRERVHRNTAESTNDRVKWWSILQAIMLLAVVGVQVFFIRRQFEAKGTIVRSF